MSSNAAELVAPASLPLVSMLSYRRPYFVIGCTLLAFFLLQYAFDVHWPMLERLQADEVYKQISGYVLIAYMLFQWYLARRRAAGAQGEGVPRQLKLHKYSGAVAPLLFFLHSTTLGYAYQSALAIAFLSCCVLGLFNIEITRIKRRPQQLTWILMHVLCATVTLILSAYHIYIVYYYS